MHPLNPSSPRCVDFIIPSAELRQLTDNVNISSIQEDRRYELKNKIELLLADIPQEELLKLIQSPSFNLDKLQSLLLGSTWEIYKATGSFEATSAAELDGTSTQSTIASDIPKWANLIYVKEQLSPSKAFNLLRNILTVARGGLAEHGSLSSRICNYTDPLMRNYLTSLAKYLKAVHPQQAAAFMECSPLKTTEIKIMPPGTTECNRAIVTQTIAARLEEPPTIPPSSINIIQGAPSEAQGPSSNLASFSSQPSRKISDRKQPTMGMGRQRMELVPPQKISDNQNRPAIDSPNLIFHKLLSKAYQSWSEKQYKTEEYVELFKFLANTCPKNLDLHSKSLEGMLPKVFFYSGHTERHVGLKHLCQRLAFVNSVFIYDHSNPTWKAVLYTNDLFDLQKLQNLMRNILIAFKTIPLADQNIEKITRSLISVGELLIKHLQIVSTDARTIKQVEEYFCETIHFEKTIFRSTQSNVRRKGRKNGPLKNYFCRKVPKEFGNPVCSKAIEAITNKDTAPPNNDPEQAYLENLLLSQSREELDDKNTSPSINYPQGAPFTDLIYSTTTEVLTDRNTPALTNKLTVAMPKNLIEINNTFKKLRGELGNAILSEWQKYSNDIFKSMLEDETLAGFYLDNINANTRIKMINALEEFINKPFSRKIRKEVMKECMQHFGVKVKNERIIPPELKGCIPTQKESCQRGFSALPRKYAAHAVPALYKFKADQYRRLANNNKKLADTSKEASLIPCIIAVPSAGQVKLIPSMLAINTNGERIELSTHIAALIADQESQCVAYLKGQKVQFNIDNHGLLDLTCEELETLQTVINKNSEIQLYTLRYQGAVKGLNTKDYEENLIEDGCDFPEEEINDVGIKQTKDFPKPPQQLLKKRKRQEFNKQIDALAFIEDEPPHSKQKLNNTLSAKGKFKSRRKETMAEAFDINHTPIELNILNSNGSEKQGELFNINKENVANEELQALGLDASLQDIFSHTIKQVADKVASDSALIQAKKGGILTYPNIKKIKNYIRLSKNKAEFENASIPLIETLKPYQIDALRKIMLQIKCGMTPLCSLWMGLGKTYIYANICAELLAEETDGVISILVPAATRDKTIQEIRSLISEAKISALKILNKHNHGEFQRVWKNQMYMACELYGQIFTKNKYQRPKANETFQELYWNIMHPLLATAHLYKGNFQYNSKLIIDSISIFLNNLQLDSKLEKELAQIGGIKFLGGKASWTDFVEGQKEILSKLSQIGLLTKFTRNSLPQNVCSQFSQDKCMRLINYDIRNIILPTDLNSIEQAYKTKNAIIIMGYEKLKNAAQKNTKLNKLICTTKHHAVFADEASKYHSEAKKKIESKSLSTFMEEYSRAVQQSGGFFLGVTATPFENSINELIKLLKISNKPGDFKAATLKTVLQLRKEAVESVCDSITSQKGEFCRNKIFNSFAQATILAKVIEHSIVYKSFSDHDVKQAWGDNIPTENRIVSNIPLGNINKELINKINKVCYRAYSSETKDIKSKSDISIIGLTPRVTRLIIDGEEGPLTIKQDATLAANLNSLASRIENFIASNKESNDLDKYFLAKTLINNKEFNAMMRSKERGIVVFEYKAEASVLETVLTKYYKKNVIIFGRTDKQRSEALEQLRKNKNTILLLPAKAGGVGLNLGDIDNLVFLRHPWNPASERQFIARVLRVGRGGRRNILELNFEHIHSSFVQRKTIEKTLASQFFLTSIGNTKERYANWCEIIVQKVLQNFMLHSSKQLGYYGTTPILQSMERAESRVSVERSLRKKIDDYLNTVDFDSVAANLRALDPLTEVEDPETSDENLSPMEISLEETTPQTPAAEVELNCSNWQMIPLPSKWDQTQIKRFAAGVADPQNKEIVVQSLANLTYFLRKQGKSVSEKARQEGDRGVMQLLARFDQVNATSVVDFYEFKDGKFKLNKTEGTFSSSRGKIFEKIVLGEKKYDALIPIEIAEEMLHPKMRAV